MKTEESRILPDDVLLTIPQAMERLDVSRSWIYKMKKAGRLPFVKIGGMSRIRESALRRMVQETPADTRPTTPTLPSGAGASPCETLTTERNHEWN